MVVDAKNVQCAFFYAIWNYHRCISYHELARLGHTANPANTRVQSKKAYCLKYMLRDFFYSCRVLKGNMGTQSGKVRECFSRPVYVHIARARGRDSSFLVPHEATHFLTSLCDTPFPALIEAMAFITPSTCHFCTVKYSSIAWAARKEPLRPVCLASCSKPFLTAGSMRTERVTFLFAVICVQCNTFPISPQQHPFLFGSRGRLAGRWLVPQQWFAPRLVQNGLGRRALPPR